MKLEKVRYSSLSNKQKEQYNYHKVSALLADYGFAGIILADDYKGADFLAVHKDGEILKVQLKGRVTIDKKYQNKDIYIAFPIRGRWCFIAHDELMSLKEISVWLKSNAWIAGGSYHSASPSKALTLALEPYLL